MRFDIVRQPLGLTALLVTLLLLLFGWRVSVAPVSAELAAIPPTPLGVPLHSLLAPCPWLQAPLVFLLTFLSAFLMTRIVTRNMVLTIRTYLPALFFAIVGQGIYASAEGFTTALATLLLVRGCELLIRSYQRKAGFDTLFRGSFLLGTAGLLYTPALLFFPAIPVALSLFRRNGRESVVALAGYLLPLGITSYIYWGAGYSFGFATTRTLSTLSFHSDILLLSGPDIPRIVLISLIILLCGLSIGTFIAHASQARTRARRICQFFLCMLPCCLAAFLLPGRSASDFSLLAIPLSVIAPYYFIRHTGLFSGLFYLLILSATVVANVLAG